MTTKVDLGDRFEKDLKHLRRPYPGVLKEVLRLVEQLENDERLGDKVQGVGHDVYKVRLKNPSAQKGKSGGFRVIYYVRMTDHIILVTIYSKTEQNDISADEIRQLIEELQLSEEDDTEE